MWVRPFSRLNASSMFLFVCEECSRRFEKKGRTSKLANKAYGME